jgi:hypothetical protein
LLMLVAIKKTSKTSSGDTVAILASPLAPLYTSRSLSFQQSPRTSFE